MSDAILQRDSLPRGGFAGLREHRMVMDPKAFGKHINPGTWPGVGNFVYLADARFMPHGDTGMHGHREIDVISVMVEGRISHEGSLEHGTGLEGKNVQVQRAGGEGFSHNEINPDGSENRMIQLWVAPETAGECAGYKHYQPKPGEVTRVYGGAEHQDDTFAAATSIDVALLSAGQSSRFKGPVLAYVTTGSGTANDANMVDGDLMRGNDLLFTAHDDVHLIVVAHNDPG